MSIIKENSTMGIKSKTSIPFIACVIGAVLMFITIFLPYATATAEQAERFKAYPDEIVYEELDMTAKDMVNISMVEYAKVYSKLSEEFWGDSLNGIIYVLMVALIGIFSLLSALFSLLKKPIAVMAFGLLAFGVFSLQCFDYKDRGVIPSSSYKWGAAYYIFYIALAVVIIGSAWMLASEIIKKKKQKQA